MRLFGKLIKKTLVVSVDMTAIHPLDALEL